MQHKIIAFFVFLFLVFGILFLLRQKFFVIQTVVCEFSDGQTCDGKINIESFRNIPLFFTDFENTPELRKQLNELQFQLLDYKILLPKTLLIIVDDEPILYELAVPDGTVFLVTRSGKIISNRENTDDGLYKFKITNSVVQLISDNELNYRAHTTLVTLKKLLDENSLNVREIFWDEENTMLVRLDSSRQLLIDPDSINTLFDVLPAVLQAAERNQSDDKVEIDLRFALPVLRTPQ